MTEPFDVVKYEYATPGNPPSPDLSPLGEAIREAANRAVLGMHRLMNATPEQRAEWAAAADLREAEAARERAEQRSSTAAVPLTLDSLIDRLEGESGWDRAYAEHLVQPYCECGEDIDGWSYCQHARDLGLVG